MFGDDQTSITSVEDVTEVKKLLERPGVLHFARTETTLVGQSKQRGHLVAHLKSLAVQSGDHCNLIRSLLLSARRRLPTAHRLPGAQRLSSRQPACQIRASSADPCVTPYQSRRTCRAAPGDAARRGLMGAKTLAPLAVVPHKSAKLGYMIHDEETPLDVEPHVALGHLEKYMAERAALVSAHHHRELAAAQVPKNHPVCKCERQYDFFLRSSDALRLLTFPEQLSVPAG